MNVLILYMIAILGVVGAYALYQSVMKGARFVPVVERPKLTSEEEAFLDGDVRIAESREEIDERKRKEAMDALAAYYRLGHFAK